MSKNKDFTRWNRAGLDQFRYVGGNAATFLETLRGILIEKYQDDDGNLIWTDLKDRIIKKSNETSSQKSERMLAQYETESDDYAWEIAKVLCRSTHVLGEYLNAYSNETFIETASEWENIRRLVNMLDYHPSPPASASTWLAIEAKEGLEGAISTGFQIKNAPDDGSSPVVFETLEDVSIDSNLNNVKPAEWNKSQEVISESAVPAQSSILFPLDNEIEDLSAGSMAILLVDNTGYSALVEFSCSSCVILKMYKEFPANIKLSRISLLLNPETIQSPMLHGEGVVCLESKTVNVTENSAIAWEKNSQWHFGLITKIDGDRIKIKTSDIAKLPDSGTDLYLLMGSYPQKLIISSKPKTRIVLPKKNELKAKVWDTKGNTVIVKPKNDGDNEIYQYLKGGSKEKLYYLPKDSEPFACTGEKPENGVYKFTGKPGDLSAMDWVLASTDSGFSPVIVEAVTESEDSFTISVKPPVSGVVNTIYNDFSEKIFPKDYDKNKENIIDIASESVTGSTIQLDSLPLELKKGSRLSISDSDNSVVVKVAAVDTDKNCVIVTPSIADLTEDEKPVKFLKYNTVLSGNIVKAGHGEVQNVIIAGSGNAAKIDQSFILDPSDITFVSDSTMSSGMRAAIEVEIVGQTYKNVVEFTNSKPADPHYTVRITETGQLKITFGDGKNGRRLPTGRNNVRVICRTGAGEKGNILKNTLTEIVSSNPLVERVYNPVDCAGGNDCETVESLKENASSSILTLGKAVSVSDFENMAVSHSSVWKATAYTKMSGYSRDRLIKVIIVPSGGKIQTGLNTEIADYLTTVALPGVRVDVGNYRSLYLGLKIVARINVEEYDSDQVETEIRAALLEKFSLSSGHLGETVYRSQVYNTVETVTGVMNSTCIIKDTYIEDQIAGGAPENKAVNIVKTSDGIIKTIIPAKDHVVYINESQPELDIKVESYLDTESLL